MEPVVTFLVPNKHRRQFAYGAAVVASLSILGAAGAWLIEFKPCGQSEFSDTTLHAIFSGLILGIGAYLIALSSIVDARPALLREVTFDADRLTLRWRRRTVSVALGSETRVRWLWKGVRNEVEIASPDGRARLRLWLFPVDEQVAMIRLLRARVPEESHLGWPAFCRGCALPAVRKLFPVVETSAEPLKPGEYLLGRRRFDRLFLFGAVVGLAVGILAWWITGELHRLAAPLILGPLWLIGRFLVPSKGIRVTPLPGDGPFFVAFLCGFGMMPLFLLCLAGGLVERGSSGTVVPAVTALACVIAAFAPAVLVDRHFRASRRAAVAAREAAAVAEWEALTRSCA